jgi:hypothetical protein
MIKKIIAYFRHKNQRPKQEGRITRPKQEGRITRPQPWPDLPNMPMPKNDPRRQAK